MFFGWPSIKIAKMVPLRWTKRPPELNIEKKQQKKKQQKTTTKKQQQQQQQKKKKKKKKTPLNDIS